MGSGLAVGAGIKESAVSIVGEGPSSWERFSVRHEALISTKGGPVAGRAHLPGKRGLAGRSDPVIDENGVPPRRVRPPTGGGRLGAGHLTGKAGSRLIGRGDPEAAIAGD